MADDDQPDKSFAVDPDVSDILETLRNSRMQWIADEIEHRIWEGSTERASDHSKKKETQTESVQSPTIEETKESDQSPKKKKPKDFKDVRGLTNEEQTTTLLRALKNYIQLPPRIWQEAQKSLVTLLSEDTTGKLTQIRIVPPGDNVEALEVVTKDQETEITAAWNKIEGFP